MISGTRYRISSDVARQTRLAEALTREQTAISTGKRIDVPSDDVVGSARISQLARAKANQVTWTGNADAAAAQATQVDDAMDGVQTQIARVVCPSRAVGAAAAAAHSRTRAGSPRPRQ